MNLIGILQKIQSEAGYLKKERLVEVSEKFDIPLSRIYSIVTFFKSFSLVPPAKHRIMVCTGTACHVRGAPQVAERISQHLGVKPGEVTSDGNFKLETVNCLGACALGPLVLIDKDYYGKMTPQKILKVIKNIGNENK